MENLQPQTNAVLTSKYSHPIKLSQAYYHMMFHWLVANPQLRSGDILEVLSRSGISISKRWVNMKLKQFNPKRPLGRPPKSYYVNRLVAIEKIVDDFQRLDQIGIPLLMDVMDGLGLTSMFTDVLQKATLGTNTSDFPSNKQALDHLIHTLSPIILDPRVHNFEEARRSEMPYAELDVERARRLTKELEKMEDLISLLITSFLDFWVKLLGLDKSDKKLILFIDGHGNPYYTKKEAVSGRISVTEKIMPGTHHTIVNDENGFVLMIFPEAINQHLNHGLLKAVSQIKEQLGDRIELVVVDRECNGAEFNQKLNQEYGVKVLTGLRSNQYKSIEDFEYEWLSPNILAKGHWKDQKKRIADNRTFLLYPQHDRIYVLTTTSENDFILENAIEHQKSRWEFNENVIKLLVNEFDLNTNVGNGTVDVPNPRLTAIDKEYQSKLETCEKHIEKLEKQLNQELPPSKKKEKEKSKSKWEEKKINYTKEMEDQQAKVNPLVKDRILEPQTLFSTLRAALFNMIMYLMWVSFENGSPLEGGLESCLDLLINRSGYRTETENTCVYYFHPPNYNKDYRKLEIVLEGITRLGLREKGGA